MPKKKMIKAKAEETQSYKRNYPKLADNLEFIAKCEWREVLQFLGEIEKRNPSERESIKKMKYRLEILRKDVEELRAVSAMRMFVGLLELCPQLEKPVREYLKQERKKVS